MTDRNSKVDLNKRRTLKCLASSAGASAAIVTLPSFANSAVTSAPVAIDATLISIPGTTNETLILRNLTDKPLTLNRFEQANITFDGETIDCGAVCNNGMIVIPAHDDVMVHFTSDPNQHQLTVNDDKLNVQAVVSRLPEGTRVIPLTAYVVGTAAVLLHA